MVNLTIAYNFATLYGGGIYCESSAEPVGDNLILWGNTGLGTSGQVYELSGTFSMTYSCVQGGWTGIGNIFEAPVFVDTTWNDYRLQWGSPCIDTGNPDPQYNDPDGTVADMGAYYYDQNIAVRILLTPHGVPITIPSGGGSFDYTIQATSIVSALWINVWCDVTMPDQSIFGPVLGPVSVTLDSGITISRERTQTVPAGAPAGIYCYNAYASTGVANSTDSFTFVKLDSDGLDGLSGWFNTGESFDDLIRSKGEAHLASTEYTLSGAFPNPFNQTTGISFQLPSASYVNLTVYDISGRIVTEIISGWRVAGAHEVTFDGSGLASGVYIYRLNADDFTASGKMVLIK